MPLFFRMLGHFLGKPKAHLAPVEESDLALGIPGNDQKASLGERASPLASDRLV